VADHEQKDEGQGAEIVHLSDLPTVTLTIRVTDDEMRSRLSRRRWTILALATMARW